MIYADPRRLRACVSDPSTKEAVLLETEASQSMGVRVTPTFFVNGKMAVGLAALEEELRRLFPQGEN